MTTKKITRTIELTVEQSRRIWATNKRSAICLWCPICECRASFVAPETIAGQRAVGQREIFRRLENGELGFAESATGTVLVCARCFAGEKYER